MENQLGKILNSVLGGLAAYQIGTNLKTLMYTDGIPKMQGFTREEYEEAVKQDAMDIVFEEDRQFLKATVQQAVLHHEQLHISYRVYCKDRSTIWVNLSAYPGDYGENETPVYHAIFSNSSSQFNLYQDICDNSITGIMVMDAVTTEVYYANHFILKMCECGPEHYRGSHVRDFFQAGLTEEKLKILQKEKGGFIHRIFVGDSVFQIHSRRIFWMKQLSILIYVTDITSEYRKQEELQRRYEEQVSYSRMLSATSLASSMVNLTKNYITLQNTADAGLMAVISRQTPQEGFESMYSHIPDSGIRGKYMAVFDTQMIAEDFEKGITHKSIRHPYDDFSRWIESSYDAVRNPRNGDLEIYCFAKDVTQEEMQKSVTKTLMSHEYDDVLLIHPKTGEPTPLVYGSASRVYMEQERTHDYSKGLEAYFLKYSADDDAAQAAKSAGLEAVTEALKSQAMYVISYSVYDDNHRIIRKRATYTYLNPYKTSIICTIQDITADFENELAQREVLQSALEDARRAMKAKTDFLSNMSHDMRTPMNAILGLSSLGMNLNTVDELKDYLLKINASGKQLLGLINDILDISRIENGKLTMNREYVKSSHILFETTASSRVVAEQKGVHFEVIKEDAPESFFYVDTVKIVKIFTNLLANAIKFTPVGGTVTYIIKRLSQTGMEANYLLVVKDTGIGMSQEFLRYIYEPFSQERVDYSTNATGTGLGMTIAKELIDFLGGRIEIQSEPDRGTEISVWMPFLLADKQPEKKEQKKFEPVKGTRKILVAEDHPLNAQIIEKLLENFGYQSLMVGNGSQCVSTFKAAPPGEYAAILMDIRMPVMDGLEAARLIRRLDKADAADIPIIAMTANAFEQDVKACMEAGMDAHLAKPIETDKLYELLSNIIGRD